MKGMSMRRSILAMALAAAALSAPAAAKDRGGCAGSPSQKAAIETLEREFVAAWLANDATRVGALLADEMVIIPHHGVKPRVGKPQVMAFWFPDDPKKTVVTKFATRTDDISVCGSTAIARGRLDVIEWEYDGKTVSNGNGNWLTVFRRQGDGQWLMTHRIWNDPPNQVR
jgi:uncharacterized protein (TIGR02246 family)